MRKIVFTIFITFGLGSSFAQNSYGSEAGATGPALVKWMTFEEAVEKSKLEKRKIFIDVFTEWCGWCKVMDKNTFTDPEVAKVLNAKFYPVKFDAEQTGDITFRGTTFKFVPYGNNGSHQLAMALLNNQMSYPNFVFLDEDFRIVPVIPGSTSVPGYRKPEEFHVFLSYVSGDFFKTQNIQDYSKNDYKSPYQSGKVGASNGSGK